MFKCPKCSTQNLDDAKYCKECGTEIWYYQPIRKLPASEITVEILFNNITRSMKQFKISAFTYKVLEVGLINYISDPPGWPTQFAQMYFKNCNLYDLFQEFQAIVASGYYLAIAIEKTTGKIIDIPIEIIDQLEVDYSAKWICDFSHEINSKGTEIIENLFKENDSLSRYFNNMFPVSDNIITEVLIACAEQSYKIFISKKQLKKENLLEIEQNIIATTIHGYISWGVWIRFVERMAEIYRDTYH